MCVQNPAERSGMFVECLWNVRNVRGMFMECPFFKNWNVLEGFGMFRNVFGKFCNVPKLRNVCTQKNSFHSP